MTQQGVINIFRYRKIPLFYIFKVRVVDILKLKKRGLS